MWGLVGGVPKEEGADLEQKGNIGWERCWAGVNERSACGSGLEKRFVEPWSESCLLKMTMPYG
jgi:hypothetical protein